jgi:lipoprotein
MRHIHFVILLLISCFFGACREKEDIREGGISFYFYPTECQSIATGTCVLTGQSYYERAFPNVDSYGVKASELGLWMMTGEKNLPKLIAKEPHRELSYLERRYQDIDIPREKAPKLYHLEEKLQDDYLKGLGNSRDSRSSGLDFLYLLPWEYRVTGVKNFRIEAMSPLFGQAVGTSLNRYFSIFEFRPKQVISYRTKSLAWGYRSKNKIETIEKWISLQPMAPPAIIFRLNATPPEVPARVKFITVLETTEGNVLRDTTEVDIRR